MTMTRTIVGFVSVCLVLAMLVLHAGDVHATPNWIAEFDILGQCCVDSPIQDSSGNILIDQFNNGNNVLIHRNFTITANEVFGVRGIAGAGTYTGMYMEGTDPASWPFYGYATNGVAQAWHYFDGASGQWRLYNSGDQIAVTQAGNVGVGTTVPAFTLDVAGPAHASSFPTSSDIRFKTDVRPLTGVVEKLEKIRGVSFEWSERYQALGRSTGHKEIGLVGQEVEAVFPELVTTWGDEDYRAVDYGRLTGVLVEAIKEQQGQIRELRAENSELKARLEALERVMKNSAAWQASLE